MAASGETLLVEMIVEHDNITQVNTPIHQKILRLLGEYMMIGGMPEASARWFETKDVQVPATILRTIADAYRQDFNKYAKKYQIKYVELLFDTIPALLGRIFKFSHIPGNYRKRKLQPSMDLLLKAGIIHEIIHSGGQGIPLASQAKPELFKLIFVDIALAQSILGVDTSCWLLEPETTFVNKGAITEAFVGQELLAYSPHDERGQLYFWQRQARSSDAEVDYLLQTQQEVIPIEVKRAAAGHLKSLRKFLEAHQNTPYGVRLSSMNYDIDEHLRSLPLYAIVNLMELPKHQILSLLE